MVIAAGNIWIGVKDGDPRLVALYERHYSANSRVSRRQHLRYGVSGVGESICLLTLRADAAFIWVCNTVTRMDNQEGVQCSFFRNESRLLSSSLILDAEEIAWRRWPMSRLWTYVEDTKVSDNPGACFKHAGWRYCGRNKDGRLSILEKLPQSETPQVSEGVCK